MGKKIPVHITANGVGNTHVFVDGKDVTANLTDVRVDITRGDAPRLFLTYVCYDQLDIEGEFEVVHVCPASARRKTPDGS